MAVVNKKKKQPINYKPVGQQKMAKQIIEDALVVRFLSGF